jgi:MFS family permease
MIRAVVLAAAFLSGAALMSLEMIGFRVVQPVFGSDIYVYGSLISVFLGGLALGAFVGGRLADREPSFGMLAGVLGFAGLLVVAVPLVDDWVMDWTFPDEGPPTPVEWDETGQARLSEYQYPDLKWPVLACGAILFGAPATLLGMVTPYAAKLLIHTLGHLGSGVGKISGISTVGAIVGTLGTAFYLVAWMGTRWLLAANGLMLVGLGLALALVHLAMPRPEPTAPPV